MIINSYFNRIFGVFRFGSDQMYVCKNLIFTLNFYESNLRRQISKTTKPPVVSFLQASSCHWSLWRRKFQFEFLIFFKNFLQASSCHWSGWRRRCLGCSGSSLPKTRRTQLPSLALSSDTNDTERNKGFEKQPNFH